MFLHGSVFTKALVVNAVQYNALTYLSKFSRQNLRFA